MEWTFSESPECDVRNNRSLTFPPLDLKKLYLTVSDLATSNISGKCPRGQARNQFAIHLLRTQAVSPDLLSKSRARVPNGVPVKITGFFEKNSKLLVTEPTKLDTSQ